MARLFNAYVFVRWSAASKPTAGADAILLGVLKRDVRFRLAYETLTAATRAEGERLLGGRARGSQPRHRERVLLAGRTSRSSFPEVSPPGAAAQGRAAMASGVEPARAHGQGQGRQHQQPFRGRLGDQPPPHRRPLPLLGLPAARRPHDAGGEARPRAWPRRHPPEFRLFEQAAKATSPTWKLYYAEPMGALAILGIPMLAPAEGGPRRGDAAVAVRDRLQGARARPISPASPWSPPRPIRAFPPPSRCPGETPRGARTRGLLEQLARLDEAGKLGARFGPPKDAAPDTLAVAESEEGWGLGL